MGKHKETAVSYVSIYNRIVGYFRMVEVFVFRILTAQDSDVESIVVE